VTKVCFPRQILPVSVIVTNLVHFAIQSSLILLALLLFPPQAQWFGWQLLWLPVILVVHIGLAMGLGLLVAGLNVVYRDVQYIVESTMTVMFWICPLIYDPVERGRPPEWAFWLYYSNPLAGLIDSYRQVLYYGKPPHLGVLALAFALTLAIGACGVRSFWKHEHRFADLL
jgi:ABC-type polysaccharide/polyol phosphate export permease